MDRRTSRLVLADEVCDAIASGVGVVALESTRISHGLPATSSAETAHAIEKAVRRAVPATVALVDGAVRVGLDEDQLVRVADCEGVVTSSVAECTAGPASRGTRPPTWWRWRRPP